MAWPTCALNCGFSRKWNALHTMYDMAAKMLKPLKICANVLALKNKHCKIVFNFTTLKKQVKEKPNLKHSRLGQV